MKKLLFVFVLGAFAACGGSDANTESTDTTTSSSATMSTDTTGTTMRADTTTTISH